jgi:hypothetical protein
MVPVGQRGHQNAFEVPEDPIERFTGFGSGVGQRVANLARCDARQDGVGLGVAKVLGDPFYERMAVAPEL